jgi:hypothetical protein
VNDDGVGREVTRVLATEDACRVLDVVGPDQVVLEGQAVASIAPRWPIRETKLP